jgi:pimeloyl-ACP methyl ester carboxylesterase
MATALIQPEFGVHHEPQLEAVHDPGEIFVLSGVSQVGRSNVDWTVAIPENRTYDGIGMFVPGYGGAACSSLKPAEEHVNQGLAMVWVNPARKSDVSVYSDLKDAQALHVRTIKVVLDGLRQQASTIKAKIPDGKRLDFTRTTLIPHSMGGLSATRYAQTEPGSTEAILHKASCGFGHPTPAELLADLPKGALAGLLHEVVPSVARGDIKVTLENTWQLVNYFRHLHVLTDGLSCLTDRVVDGTERLMSAGVHVDYEAYEHDILVRPDPSVAQYVNSHRMMRQAGHLAPIHKARAVARDSAKTILGL